MTIREKKADNQTERPDEATKFGGFRGRPDRAIRQRNQTGTNIDDDQTAQPNRVTKRDNQTGRTDNATKQGD